MKGTVYCGATREAVDCIGVDDAGDWKNVDSHELVVAAGGGVGRKG